MSKLPADYLRVAKLGKVVGLKGEINLWPISNIDERFHIGSRFFLESGNELVLVAVRNKKDHLIVKFDSYNSRESVEGLVNEVVYGAPLDRSVLDEGEFFIHECIDRTIVDQNGVEHGVAVRFHSNSASDLLENDRGELIPFRFIVDVGEKVHVDVPDGLFESEPLQ